MFGKLEKLTATLKTTILSMLFIQGNFLYAYGLELNPDWYPCKVEFKDKDAKLKDITDCAAKVNYKLPADDSFESIKAEFMKLSASDFDDMCFSKCWHEKSNLLGKDGKVISENLANYYKTSNMSQPLLKEYIKLYDECVKETEPKFKDSKEIPCKMYTVIDFCCFSKFEEHKSNLEEICKKSNK